jgi:hypothetical protein
MISFAELASLPHELEQVALSFVRVERLLIVTQQGQVFLFDLLTDALVASFDPPGSWDLWLNLKSRQEGGEIITLSGSNSAQDCPFEYFQLHLNLGGPAKQLERNPGPFFLTRFFGFSHRYTLSCEHRGLTFFACDSIVLPNPREADVKDEREFLGLQIFDGPLDEPTYRTRRQQVCTLENDTWTPLAICPKDTKTAFSAIGRLFSLSETGLRVLVGHDKWVILPGISTFLRSKRAAATLLVPAENCVQVAFCNFNQTPQFVEL